jgi:hypothetical protein
LAELVQEKISNYGKKTVRWNETLGGMAVVIMSRPTNIPLNRDEVVGGIKEIRRCCSSSSTVTTQLQILASYGLLKKQGGLKAGTAYYLNFEIPGELLASQD